MNADSDTRLSIADYVTIANSSVGLYAVILMLQGSYYLGSILILVSCLLDLLDGKIAKMTKGSMFGGDLDSLVDIIGFGMAPAGMLYSYFGGYLGIFCAAFWVAAGILRLARFNVIKTPYYIGLPLSIAALVVIAMVLLKLPSVVVAVVALITASLMVSSIKIYKNLDGFLSNFNQKS